VARPYLGNLMHTVVLLFSFLSFSKLPTAPFVQFRFARTPTCDKRTKTDRQTPGHSCRYSRQHALCAPGQHTANRRKKCTRQSRSCMSVNATATLGVAGRAPKTRGSRRRRRRGGWGLGRGCAPFQKIYDFFPLKMVWYGAFWVCCF